jgi:hypothetical protein
LGIWEGDSERECVPEGTSAAASSSLFNEEIKADIMTVKQYGKKAMIQTLDALFDGAVLLPEVPLNIKSGTRVRIIVESLLPDEKPKPKTFLQTAKSLNLQGRPDWSTNIDQYLHEENISENE